MNEETINQIRESNDIVEVASQYLRLRKAGKNYKALCPFHSEKTPSFLVSAEKGIFHCFGCGMGGNVFNLVMKMEKLSFPEAARLLAKRAGIIIPEESREGLKQLRDKEKSFKINEEAARLYSDYLEKDTGGQIARNYLKKRGLNQETIKAFLLGYAPGGNFICRQLKKEGYTLKELQGAGLAKEGRGDDYFFLRLIIPIIDTQDRVCGFAGRVLGDGMPKYLNTAQGSIFNKGAMLYGLNLGRSEIQRLEEAIVVEGYFDVIGLAQMGIKNVVASMGTSLTQPQCLLLKRFVKKVILCYDADVAGKEATLRGMNLLVEKEMDPYIITLSSTDPDEIVRKGGRQAFLDLTKKALTVIDYHFQRTFARYDAQSNEGKLHIVKELIPVFHKIKNHIQKGLCVQRLARELGLEEKLIYLEMQRMNSEKSSRQESVIKFALQSPAAEMNIIQLALDDETLIPHIQRQLQPEDLSDAACRSVLKALFDIFKKSGIINIKELIDYLKDEALAAFIARLSLAEHVQAKEKILEDCIAYIKKNKLRMEMKSYEARIRMAQQHGQEEEIARLLKEYQGRVSALVQMDKKGIK